MRCLQDRVGIDAAYLLSKINFAKGKVDEAFFYAKNAVRLSSRLWAKLEKQAGSKLNKKEISTSEAETDALVEKLAAVDLSSGSEDCLKGYRIGSVYWPHFSSHCTALRQLSRISAHSGLYQDATYYAQQALDVSKAIGASRIASLIKAELGTYYIRGEQLEKGQQLLEEAGSEPPAIEKTVHDASLQYHLSILHRFRREPEDEYQMLDGCHTALMELSQTGTNGSPPRTNVDIAEIQTKMGELNIDNSTKSRPQRRTRRVHPSEKTSKRAEKAPARKVCEEPGAGAPSLSSHLRGEILRRQTAMLLSDNQLQEAAALLDTAEKLPQFKSGRIAQQIQRANLLLNQAIHKLTGHGVYCVLPESCVALPSIQSTTLPDNQRSSSSSTTHSAESPKKKSRARALGPKKRSRLVEDEFTAPLSIAQQNLHAMCPLALAYGSTMDGHVYSYLASRVSALSYATSKGDVTVEPLRTVQLKGMAPRLFSIRG